MGYRFTLVMLFISMFVANIQAQNQSKQALQQATQILQDRGEVVIQFHVASKDEINNDLTNIVSIDNVKPSATGLGYDVTAYANAQEFQAFLSRNIPYVVVPKLQPKALNMATTVAQMASWDRYPTYSVYEQMLANFASTYPTLCDIDTVLASTPSGNYKILVAKISDNVNTAENEPQFLYSSSIHGDETTGYYLMLRMISYLLTNYGTITQVTNLVNGVEIWICPLANPEGTYYLSSPVGSTVANSRRANLAGIDLNRNYKDPAAGDHPDLNSWAPETQAFMTLADNHHFNMGANFHGGAEVTNYPWDTWTTAGNPNADAAWWERVCTNYVTTARAVTAGYMTDTYTDGVTEGGDWYVITGGRQDYMGYFHQCREVTIELDDVKTTATENLNGMWNTNYQSLLNYMQESMYGIRGIITDSCTGQPIRAKVFANSYDQANDSSHVYSALPVGNYHKYVNTGTYSLTFSAPGYVSKTITGISVTNGTATTLNVALVQPAPVANFSANVTSTCNGSVQFTNTGTYAAGSTFLWNFGDGQTSTLENPQHTYTSNGTYTVQLTITACAGSDNETKTSYITVNMPTTPTATGATLCGSGTATLTASGTNTLNWYSAATGGTLLGTGSSYTTPTISSTTTYYVENSVPGTSSNVGPTVGGASRNVEAILYFDVYQPMTLVSVQAMAGTAGNKTITLLDGAGATVYTSNVNVNTTTTTVTLNWLIQPGTGYQLLTPLNSTLYRINSGVSYPYTATGLCSITGCDIGNTYYYSWFNWTVQGTGCSSSRVPVTATVQTPVTPAFNAAGPYCVGATPATLATTSTNGITGSWSPSAISTATAGTTTYTFTPTAGQCATTATLNVTVNAVSTPSFNAIGPYCVGQTPASLPTTSTNSITGTWNPTTVSTATAGTTTYTFTPTAGQCALGTNMNITVNSVTTPSFAAMGPYCQGATPATLPGTSTNGIAGTWSPTTISTASGGTTTYYFTPTTGQCASNSSINVVVNNTVTPSFSALGPYCTGATPDILPSVSLNGVTGSWSPSTINTASAGTTTFTFTPDGSQCATTASMSIEVGTNITPSFGSYGPYCIGSTPVSLPVTSLNGITGTWNPSVISTSGAGTTNYSFTPDAGQCAVVTSLNISVVNETMPSFGALGPYCVGETPALLPNTSTNGITGIWSPSAINTSTASNNTYSFTPNTGQCATAATMSISVNQNITPTFSIVTAYCVGATPNTLPSMSGNGISGTWSPSAINTATAGTASYTFTPSAGQCATPLTLSVAVGSSITPVFSVVTSYCQGSTANVLPGTSNNGITGNWSPASINTATGGSSSYTFTPNAGQCASTTNITVVIDNSTTPVFASVGPYCQGDSTSMLPLSSQNGVSGTWSPASISTTAPGTYNYVFTPDTGQCASSTSMTVSVTAGSTPPFSVMGPYCLGSTAPSLPATALNGVTGSWSPATINTAAIGTSTYTFTPTPGQCASQAALSITVKPVYSGTESHTICQGNSYLWMGTTYTSAGTYTVTYPTSAGCDSSFTLILTVNPSYSFDEEQTICNGSSYTWHGNTYSMAGTYYDHHTTTTGCDSSYVLHLNVGQAYTFVENKSVCEGESYTWHGNTYNTTGSYQDQYISAYGCDSTYTLNLTVNPAPVVFLGNDTTLCSDQTLLLDAGNTGASFLWSEGAATTQTFVFDGSSHAPYMTYPVWVRVDNGCISTDTIEIYNDFCDGLSESGSLNVLVYPNPTDGVIYLASKDAGQSLMVTLTSPDGRIVFDGWMNNLTNDSGFPLIDFSSYPAGVYYLRLRNEHQLKVFSIIKQ